MGIGDANPIQKTSPSINQEEKNLPSSRFYCFSWLIVVGPIEMVPKGLKNRQGELKVDGRIRAIQTFYNTEKSPGYLRRLAVT